MSIAGRRSNQGDEYQLRVAVHWLIQLLDDESIKCIQVDSTGIPEQDFLITVDDVVVIYKNGRTLCIQAKKNQTNHENWTLSDKTLKDELRKSCQQLESSEQSEVRFYSRSPFGELKSLVENCKYYTDYQSFYRSGNQKQIKLLEQLSTIIDRGQEATFYLAHRISFGTTYEFEDWDRENLKDLDRIFPQSNLVLPILERYLSNHEAGLRCSEYTITRDGILTMLQRHGLNPAPMRSEAEILTAFQKGSAIGRHWLCTIDDQKIPRIELSQILKMIEEGTQTILLTDRPGSGKTCLLLDLAAEIEKADSLYGLLFIKGDQFTDINSEEDLFSRGLPQDIVGQCARLVNYRRVIVVIDSLDVLSLNRQHSALKIFLGLIDRLEKIEKVTIVVACRNFDLQYDPLLRGRSWAQTIDIKPLDFDTIVCPFLRQL